MPELLGVHEFLFGRSPFQEQTCPVWREVWDREFKEFWERCDGPRCNQIHFCNAENFDAVRMDGCLSACDAGGFYEKSGFSTVTFHEVEVPSADDCQDETGESGARANIQACAIARADQGRELQRIGDVPRPKGI
jgi:hypothetical protein